ncbi:MAG: ATP-binding protein [Armatimonadota bacterium]
MRELSLHILDIMQNSIAAGAWRIDISVKADTKANTLQIRIDDNGKGMDPEFLRKVQDPFTTTRTTRKVGLGIPMLAAASELCGGKFSIDSEQGKGTSVSASFVLNHIDRAQFGDIVSTIITSIAANPDLAIKYEQDVDGRQFVLDTDEIRMHLEDVPVSDPTVIRWIRDYMKEGLASIGVIQ